MKKIKDSFSRQSSTRVPTGLIQNATDSHLVYSPVSITIPKQASRKSMSTIESKRRSATRLKSNQHITNQLQPSKLKRQAANAGQSKRFAKNEIMNLAKVRHNSSQPLLIQG